MKTSLITTTPLSRPRSQAENRKIQFFVLYLVWVLISFKPEWTIPGFRSIAPLISLTQVVLFFLWFSSSDKRLENPMTKCFLLLLVSMAVSSFFARNNGLTRETLQGMVLLFFTCLGTITFADSEKRIYSLFKIYLLGGIFIALLSIKGQGLAQGVTIYADENDLALAMNVFFSLALFLGIAEKDKLKKSYYFIACVIFIIPTLISQSPSRGGFLGLAAVLLFAWFKLPMNKFKSALIVLFVSLGMLYFAPQSFWDEMSTLSDGAEQGTGAARVFFWKVAVQEFLDHPILGVGINNYGVWLPEYVDNRVEFDNTIFSGATRAYGRVNHSLYFTLLSELGSIGVVLFTIMLYRFYKELRFDRKIVDASAAEKLRNCRNLSMALLGGMIGFLVSGAFITVLYYPYFWLMCSLAVALGNCKRKILKETAAMPDRGLSLSMKKIQ